MTTVDDPRPLPHGEPQRIRVRRQRADDDALLAWARDGEGEALAELYRRHRTDALRYAQALCRRARRGDVADDVLAEAVRKTLLAISRGNGPVTGFRPYLFTVIRSVAATATMRPPSAVVAEEVGPEQSIPGPDDDLNPSVARDALTSLPPRWQGLLWATAVTGVDHEQLASTLGISPAAVASMAMRAREALRVAFVRSHLPRATDPQCAAALDLIARGTVTDLTTSQRRRLDRHLGHCPSCRDAPATIHTEFASSSRLAGSPVGELFRPSRTSHRRPERDTA